MVYAGVSCTYLAGLASALLRRGLLAAGVGAAALLLLGVGRLEHGPHAHVAGVQQRGHGLGGLQQAAGSCSSAAVGKGGGGEGGAGAGERCGGPGQGSDGCSGCWQLRLLVSGPYQPVVG